MQNDKISKFQSIQPSSHFKQQYIYLYFVTHSIITAHSSSIIIKLASTSLSLLLVIVLVAWAQGQKCKPFGVRLNFGQYYVNPQISDKLSIRFDTKDPCLKSFLTYEKQSGNVRKTYCSNSQFNISSYLAYMHTCTFSDIQEGDEVQYMVSGWTGNSTDSQIPFQNDLITYRLPKSSEPFKMVSVADWGYLRELRNKYKPLDDSFGYLLKTDTSINAIFINGDVAYDLDSNEGLNYEDFITMLSQVTIKWPLIISPGNHEHKDTTDSTIFNTAFQSYDVYNKRAIKIKLPQFSFLIFDPYEIMYNKEDQNVTIGNFKTVIETAAQDSEIVIPASHYPFRCNGEEKDCVKKRTQILQFYNQMFTSNVPLYLGAHYHAYQRLYPFKKDDTFVKKQNPYQWKYNTAESDRTMVSVVEGVAGNDYSFVQSYDKLQNWTAAVNYNITGYGIFAISSTNIKYQHYNTNDANIPVDSFVIQLTRAPKKSHFIRRIRD